MLSTNYEKKLQKLNEAALRKVNRLKKRIELEKGKQKQLSMKELRNKLQRITNKIVRLRYPPICYTCDKRIPAGQVQAGHHWAMGSNSAVRYDFDNLRVQGSCCNLHNHGNQGEFANRLRQEIGDERYEALYRRKNQKAKWTRQELETLIEERTKILDDML